MHSAVLCFPFPPGRKKSQRRDGGGPDKEARIKERVKRYVGRGSRGLGPGASGHWAWRVIGVLV